MTKEFSKITSGSQGKCYLLITTTFISPKSPMRTPSLPGIWTLHSRLAQLIPKEQLCYRLILSCASISWFEVVGGSVIHHFQNRSSMIQHNDNQWYLTKLAGEIFLWYKWYKWYTSNTAISSDASKTSASVTRLSSYFCLCNAYWVLTGLPFCPQQAHMRSVSSSCKELLLQCEQLSISF